MKKINLSYWLGCVLLLASAFIFTQCKKSLVTDNAPANAATATAPRSVTSFVHPGVLNTAANLDLIRNEANNGDVARNAAYQKVVDFINNNPMPTQFYSTVYVGSNGHTSPSKSQIRKDAILAYALALRFAKTGDTQWSDKCKFILNGWASTFQNYAPIDASDNPHQSDLEASWTTPSFVAAAEIIRYYQPNGVSANWSQADINTFSNYLNNVKNNYINHTFGGNGYNYNNNWNVSAGYAKMAVGVFLNSASVFNDGEAQLNITMPNMIHADGTMPEECDRTDCVHYQYSLTGFTYAAEIAAMQGDNSLYTALSNRISAGYDFMYRSFFQNISCDYCSTGSAVYGGVEVAYHHYGTSNMGALRDLHDPLGAPADNTFLGFTTYTHYNLSGGTTPPPANNNPPIGTVITLTGFNGKYVSGENGTQAMTCTRATDGDWEHFTVLDAGNGKIYLRSMGKYVSSENGAQAMTCNRTTPGDWEKFTWGVTADGKITLQGNNGKYVSSENGTQAMTCNRTTPQGWESFGLNQ
ncbi:alginate lyase family protein [Mucilaginibacter sp. 14171R-50]|uniref:alginate lyase family protein n=1 Tax=Mucilaginibacter sp. 14171R-50 TaxID=2703789 RepID=UPI00192EC911|nr:alginate lyase family protein [Mucilaginibacter sp. 14171R-50]